MSAPFEWFERQVRCYEDLLFGLTLYHATAPRLTRWLQGRSYRQTLARVQEAISLATDVLAEVRAGQAPVEHLHDFPWPPWTDAMAERIETMLRAYRRAFPLRPQEPLSPEELAKLRKTVLALL